MILKKMTVTLIFILTASLLSAAQVPGTSVYMDPPEGFIETRRFPGFIEENTGASIMVNELPGSFEDISGSFRNESRLKNQKMKLISSKKISIDSHPAVFYELEHFTQDKKDKKLALVINNAGSNVIIMATIPSTALKIEKAMKKTLFAATLGPPVDPMAGLCFTATPVRPFDIALVMGQNLVLTPEGKYPSYSQDLPFMVISMSASEHLHIINQRDFAERRLNLDPPLINVKIEKSHPITIGDLSGYVTLARGEGEKAKTPMTLYQVVLFETWGYCLMQGVMPVAEKETYMPIFEKIAGSFAMKPETKNNNNGLAGKL